MFKKTVGCVLLAAALGMAAVSAQAMEFKHQARGVTCEKCHKTASPVKAAKNSSCMECHSYADVAKKSAKLNPNPHDSHAGQVRCVKCHKEHKASVSYCSECHTNPEDKKFQFKVP